jgi:hypothetical protein
MIAQAPRVEVFEHGERAGLSASLAVRRSYTVRPFRSEIQPGVDLRGANRLLADLEDDELLHKIELGK